MEKRNSVAKTISQLNVDNKLVTNPREILDVQRDFYKKLYSSKNTNELDSDLFLDNEFIKKLNKQQQVSCEGHITVDEVKKILSSMSNNKSPGSDGYTVEFYKFFFRDIGLFLVKSLNYAFHRGELSITQNQGVITCIPKGKKAREYLKNWCPISLLNIDYKILTGILASRLKPVLCEVINEDQKGFLKNRCISENCRLLYDIMFEIEKTKDTRFTIVSGF